MREIKYRIWDKINKKWIKQFNVDLLNIDISEMHNIEIMQYTGLKDKRGKEIYEGDILNTLNSKRIVVFNEDTCSFMLKDIKLRNELFSLNKEKCTDLEIIGNIHEDPELLEEQ